LYAQFGQSGENITLMIKRKSEGGTITTVISGSIGR
jgi:hypothetical protein